jgi:hypothetical protein
MPSIKNIIIFLGIGLAMVLMYVFFIKGNGEEANLTTTTTMPVQGGTASTTEVSGTMGQDFLGLLLNVKNIKLDSTIFSNPAFISLHDSSILLIPDGNEGRANPFAPIGSDIVAPPVVSDAPDAGTSDTGTDTSTDTTTDGSTTTN